jgi:hypothetical protein
MAALSGGGAFTENIDTNAETAVAPLNQVYYQPANTVASQSSYAKVSSTATNPIAQLGQTASNVFGSIGRLGADIGKGIGHAAVSAVMDPIHFAVGTYDMGRAALKIRDLDSQQNILNQHLQNLDESYHSGKLSSNEYKEQLKLHTQLQNQLGNEVAENSKLVSHATNYVKGNAVGTITSLFAVVTAGQSETVAAALDSGDSALVNKLATGALGDHILQGAQQIDKVMGVLQTGLDKAFTWGGVFGDKTIEDTALTDGKSIANNLEDPLKQDLQDTVHEAEGNLPQGVTVAQRARAVAIGLMIKRPLIYNTAIGNVEQLHEELATGKYGDATKEVGLLGLMTLAGGPMGAAIRYGSKLAGTVTHSIFEDPSFIDGLSRYVGDKSSSQIHSELINRLRDDPEKGAATIKRIKILAATNIKAANGSVIGAIQRVVDHYYTTMQDLSKFSASDLVDDLDRQGENVQAVMDAGNAGRFTGEADQIFQQGRWALGRVSIAIKNQIANILAEADSRVPEEENQGIAGKINARNEAIQQLIDQYGTSASWVNSASFRTQLNAIIDKTDDTDKMAQAVRDIEAQNEVKGIPSDLKTQLSKNGQFLIAPKDLKAPYVAFEDTDGKLASAYGKDGVKFNGERFGAQYFNKTQTPLPVLGHVGAFLTKIGLSPEASDRAVFTVFSRNLRANLASILKETTLKLDVENGSSKSDAVTNALQNYMDNAKFSPTTGRKFANGIYDMRQLTDHEIAHVTGADLATAHEIGKSINASMAAVPLELRGLGDRIIDFNYSLNPLAGKYARIQSIGKFTLNPFFHGMQNTTTEVFSQAEAFTKTGFLKTPSVPYWNKLVNIIFQGRAAEINDTMKLMEDHGVFDAGLSGQGADDSAATFGVTSHLTGTEKNSVAGLVMTLANHQGVDVNTFLNENKDDVTNLIRSFVQYPKGGNFINSPLAKTLNLAFFPARYNLKVAGMAAKVLSQQNPFVQVAVIQGLFKAKDWLNSAEGQAWREQNNAAITIFGYISPLYSLGYVYDALNGRQGTIGGLGTLGGLPFGVISQILEAEGIMKEQPFIEVEHGKATVAPDYIPKTSLGAAAAALQGLIGSLFTYPGAQFGLPSKSKIIETNVSTVLGSSSTKDFNIVTPTNLTKTQKLQLQEWGGNQPSQIRGPNGQVVQLYDGPRFTILTPKEQQTATGSVPSSTLTPKAPKAKAKVKADFTPAPLAPVNDTGLNPSAL